MAIGGGVVYGKCTATNMYGDQCGDPCNPNEQTCKLCRTFDGAHNNMSEDQTAAADAREWALKVSTSPFSSPGSPDMDEAIVDGAPSPPYSPPACDELVVLNDEFTVTVERFQALELRLTTKKRDPSPEIVALIQLPPERYLFRPIEPAPLSVKPVASLPPPPPSPVKLEPLPEPCAWWMCVF